MDKFLLASNPMRNIDSDQFIIHMLQPKAILRCIKGHVEPGAEIFQQYQFQNKMGDIEYWTISAFYISQNIVGNREHDDITLHIIDRAWRWFRSHLKQTTKLKNQ